MLTVNELAQLSELDIEKVDQNELVSVEKVSIDPSMPAMQRMLAYINQVKNPYCFLYGNTPVKVCFSQGDAELSKKIKTYFWGLKR